MSHYTRRTPTSSPRRGPFDDPPIRVPWFLHQHGVTRHPAHPHAHRGVVMRDGYTLAVFLFVEGVDGYEVDSATRG